MYLGLSYLIEQSILTNELVVRYTTGHPISRFTTGMFFIGMASLLMIAKNVFEQFSTEAKIQLVKPAEDLAAKSNDNKTAAQQHALATKQIAKPATGVADVAAAYQNGLKEQPTWIKEHYLWQRLSAMMAYLQRSDSTANAETELKYLSELDYERQQQRFALVRILIWATPMLGFLGTVLGISEALGGISVGPENNFETMMNGLRGSLYVAFDTTALALTLSMFLMFVQFLIDRFELQLLSIVDTRVHAEVNRSFDLTTTENESMTSFSEQFLEASKQAAINQTKVWKHSIESAEKAWASTLTDTNASVQDNLTDALGQNVSKLASQLTAAIDRADNAMSHRWQQWQVTLSDNCRLLTEHQKQLAEQTSQFSKMVTDKTDKSQSENNQIKDAIAQNNHAIEATKQLRETLSTLSESVQTMQETATAQTGIASTLSESVQTMQQTATAQTEIASKLAEAAAKPPIAHQIIQPEPQVFAGKLRVHNPGDADPATPLAAEPDILKAVVEMLPEVSPSTQPPVVQAEAPTASLDLQQASANTFATMARITPEVLPTVAPKPASDVVFQTTKQPNKPSVDTIRDANQRIANFLSSQNRPTRRRSAA